MNRTVVVAMVTGLAALGIALGTAPAIPETSETSPAFPYGTCEGASEGSELCSFPYGPLPVCHEEDGSDVDGFCVWISSTGDMYLNPLPSEMERQAQTSGQAPTPEEVSR